jgi:hypothetical protein
MKKPANITLGINTVLTLFTSITVPIIGWLIVSEIKGIKSDAHAELQAQQLSNDSKYETQAAHDKDIDQIRAWNSKISGNVTALTATVQQNHEETKVAIQQLTDAVKSGKN